MSDDGGQERTMRFYECVECGHRVKIYETEIQDVFCRCEPDGPPLLPVSDEPIVNTEAEDEREE